MSLPSDIASILSTLGYGVFNVTPGSINSTIFTRREPSAPAVCTTVYGDGGAADTQDFDGNTFGERPVQVRMRDSDLVALETRMESLYTLWKAWVRYEAYFLVVKAAQKPLYNYTPQDSGQGELYIASCNFRCIQGS